MADPRLARARDPRTATPPQPPQVAPQLPPPQPPPTIIEEVQTAAPSTETPEQDGDGFKLKFCTVCASNNNRSMVSHLRLAMANYPVISFGTGSLVRLPGPTISQPNNFPFNVTAYSQMYEELADQDRKLYTNNRVLDMLERNKGVKFGPERWQDWDIGKPRLARFEEDKGSKGTEGGVVDIVITCEERCWDAVVDNLQERGAPLNRPVHVINVNITDNHEDAMVGGDAILELANSLNAMAIEERRKGGRDEWENGSGEARTGFDQRVPDILGAWQEKWVSLPALWTLAWF